MDKKEYNRKYREEHREEIRLWSRDYYLANRERMKSAARERSRKWRLEAPEEVKEYSKNIMRDWRLRQKLEVLTHYGADLDKPVCVKCGEDRLACLSIDHIDGKGRLDRRNRGVGGNLYRALIKEGFPRGFQTLCMNCQWVKRFENNEQR